MKIRTDFVTNSSSSSFVVEVEVETNEARVVFETNPIDEGANSNFKCSGKDITKADSIDGLCELLQKSMSGTGKTKIKGFAQDIKDNVQDISDINTIILRRIWISQGESSGCTIANDEKLQELSKKIVKAKGEEKESLCKEMEEYLSSAEVYAEGGWQDCWPTDFCKSKAVPHYKWSHMRITVEELAKKIANNKITNNDYAVETIIVDMQKKKVDESAEFILDGSEKGIDFKKAKKSNSFVKKIIESCCPSDEVKDAVAIDLIVENCNEQCDPIDYVVYRDGQVILAISVKTAENGRSKTFKAIAPICEVASINYLLLDEKKENTETKIVTKVNAAIYKDKFEKYVVGESKDGVTEIEAPNIGTGHQIQVKFADNRSYAYNCFVDVKAGDIVYVGGSKQNCPGMVVYVDSSEVTLKEPSMGFYCVERKLNI